jgi:hypothetical protein
MECTPRADFMASSVADLPVMYFIVWGHMKERVFADPPRTIEHLMVKFKAAVMHSR